MLARASAAIPSTDEMSQRFIETPLLLTEVLAAQQGAKRAFTELLQVPAQGLLALDRLEERLEIAVAEAPRAVAFDHLEEERRPVLRRLREDLQQVAVVVAIGEDAEPAKVRIVLVDLADAFGNVVVVRVRRHQEEQAAILQRLDGLDDVRGRQRDVLHAGPVVELQVLLDLALALALGRLVDWELV